MKPHIGTAAHVALWNAIGDYAKACGGDPAKYVYGNTPRQNAVAAVERALEAIIDSRAPTPEQREAPATCEICSKYDMEVNHPATQPTATPATYCTCGATPGTAHIWGCQASAAAAQPTATKPCPECLGTRIEMIDDEPTGSHCLTCRGEGTVPA